MRRNLRCVTLTLRRVRSSVPAAASPPMGSPNLTEERHEPLSRGLPPVVRGTAPAMPQEFREFVVEVREAVESRLRPWLEGRVAQAARQSPDVAAVAEAVAGLTMRGGKRLRAVLLAAAYEACEGEGGGQAVAPVGAALELFQTYLLIHDDLIDRDEMRRGGPSVPALMRARFGASLSDAMALLAGDLASAWSQSALFEADLPPERLARAARAHGAVHEEVVAGQSLDVLGGAADAHAVEAMHALKSASYSVRGPVVMGALLAGADDARVRALAAFGEPLGVAFQLRDDVLGLFGDPADTGKPAGNDLREGKRSAVLVEALHDAETAALLAPVVGRRDASDAAVAEAVAGVERSGARARVEARIAELLASALGALGSARFAPRGAALLAAAASALTERRA